MLLIHNIPIFSFLPKYQVLYRIFSKRSLSTHVLLTFAFLWVTIGLSTLWVNYNLVRDNMEHQVFERSKFISQGTQFAIESLTEVTNVYHLSSILQRIVQNYATLPEVIEISIIDPESHV